MPSSGPEAICARPRTPRKAVAPKAVVFIHAGVAVTGFLVLLSAVLAL